jgi:hypothetical protein
VFELEIMATGYAIVVSTVTTVVCKIIGRRKLKHLKEELSAVKALLSSTQAEIGGLKIALGDGV